MYGQLRILWPSISDDMKGIKGAKDWMDEHWNEESLDTFDVLKDFDKTQWQSLLGAHPGAMRKLLRSGDTRRINQYYPYMEQSMCVRRLCASSLVLNAKGDLLPLKGLMPRVDVGTVQLKYMEDEGAEMQRWHQRDAEYGPHYYPWI